MENNIFNRVQRLAQEISATQSVDQLLHMQDPALAHLMCTHNYQQKIQNAWKLFNFRINNRINSNVETTMKMRMIVIDSIQDWMYTHNSLRTTRSAQNAKELILTRISEEVHMLANLLKTLGYATSVELEVSLIFLIQPFQ